MEVLVTKSGYAVQKKTITFICDEQLYPDITPDEKIFVTGTFNGWLNTADSDWAMQKKVVHGTTIFELQKELSSVMIPGNSGFPEFRFFALTDTSYRVLDNPADAENIFLDNKLLLVSKEDFTEAEKIKAHTKVFRSLTDFDMNCPACRAEISNVRPVSGTGCLFRGYHPFKRSRPNLDTETARLELVQKAFELYGIKSIISLSGCEMPSSRDGETMPKIIADIDNNKNHLFINIEYNLVYFHPDAAEYLNALQKVCRFIIEHPGPFYIHCRLGSDRTGVTSAILAALCGASWNQIADDYEKTYNCGIGEYRNRKLLQYSLSRLTGYNPAGSENLAYLMQSLFLKENILTSEELEKLIAKLTTDVKKKETDFFNFDGIHICGKKSANLY